MSVSTAVVTPVDSFVFGNLYGVAGTVAVGASTLTYTAGGIAMSLLMEAIKAQKAPLFVIVQGISGFTYKYVAGTTAANGKLKIFGLEASPVAYDPLIEIQDTGAIPAGVSGDTISFLAIFAGQR